MTVHNKSDTEKIFFKKQNAPTDSEGSKIYCKFFKIILTYWKVVFQHAGHHLIGHDPVSKRKKQRCSKILGHNI